MRKPKAKEAIIVAVIGAAAVIIAAVINKHPALREQGSGPRPQAERVIAGIVVDQETNQGIGQARIVLAGRAEGYVTEDSGNFRIDLQGNVPGRVRLHVTKTGFLPLDTSVEPSGTNPLVLQLRRQ